MLNRSSQHAPVSSHEIDDAVLTLSKPEAARIEWTLNRRPVTYFFGIIALTLCLLGGRFVYMNVWRGEYYGRLARENSLRSILLAAPRGIIRDRYGLPLVKNTPSLDSIIVPSALPEDQEVRQRVLDTAERLFPLETPEWREVLESRTFGPNEAVLLKEDMTQEEAILYYSQANELPGINIQKSARREYVNGTIFSHLIGYEGKIKKEELETYPGYHFTDSIGKQGVEKTYESTLRGVHGRETVEVDSLGRVKKELGIVPPEPGKDITLTIDKTLTEKLYTTMADWFAAHDLKAVAAVAIDPRSGALRALISYPGYDNNLFSGGIEKRNMLR